MKYSQRFASQLSLIISLLIMKHLNHIPVLSWLLSLCTRERGHSVSISPYEPFTQSLDNNITQSTNFLSTRDPCSANCSTVSGENDRLNVVTLAIAKLKYLDYTHNKYFATHKEKYPSLHEEKFS